jgi:rhomboid protease GluP
MVTLFEHLNREEAEMFSLVLNAVGIGHRVVGANRMFRIDVPEHLSTPALTAIHRYQSENAISPPTPATRHRQPVPLPLSGVFVALVLLAVYLAIAASAAPQDYDRVFGADARLILKGQWYRCTTALVLHADATHIAANMVGIALFGSAVCAVTGTGVGWLMILACGFFGNLMNAWFYQRDHLSVGVSTAIFGAVGILCAIQAVGAIRTGKGWKRVFLIAGAGVALLAFLGSSARSDLGAHLFGWSAGALVGGIYGLEVDQALGKRWQVTCGTIAVLTVVASWVRGVVG